MTRKFFVALTLVVVSLGCVAAPAAAQPDTPSPTSTRPTASSTTADNGTDWTWIDNSTAVISADLDRGDETVEITLYSEIPQRVTLTDSGDFVEGGEVKQRSVYLRPGETRTFEFSITVVDRGFGNTFAGVSISTPKTLYALPLESSSPLIGGPWTAGDVQLVGLVIGSGVSIITLLILLRSRFDLDADPERVA